MKLSSMDMRLFAAIAETGGITAAARGLGIAKSIVSRDLAALEARLGSRLVQRTTRRVSLTESGEMLAAYARRIVAELDDAEAAIEATKDSPRGELCVSVPFSILRHVFAPQLAAFRAAHPFIRLALDASTRISDLVGEGVDLAIRVGELPPSSLVARRLALVPVVLAAAPDYLRRRGTPQTPAELAAHDIVNLRRDVKPELWSLQTASGHSEAVKVRPVLAVHDPSLLIDLAVRGLGIAPVPELYSRRAFADGSLVPLLAPWRHSLVPIHAVYPSRRIVPPKVRAFIAFADDCFNRPPPTPGRAAAAPA